MILIDTHTHLYSEVFDQDREHMMARALKANISRFFVPAIDSDYTDAMLQLEASYPDHIFLMAGLHPTHVRENYKEELQHVAAVLQQRKYWAIGEIGIDLYWDTTFFEQQQEAFRFQIQLAKHYRLPIVIHCRAAFDAVFKVLEAEKNDGLYGIFHCFTGTLEQAKKAISYNMKLGIGGVVTFKNGKIADFLNQIALEHIVLETDAPYLAPVPYRGKRNESAYLVHILDHLAILYKRTPEEIAERTTRSAEEIFGI